MRIRCVVAALVLMGVSFHAKAQFSLTSTNYTQNFDSLGTNASSAWANNITLPGWYALGALTNPVVIANQTGSSTTGTLGNFSATAANTNRSLGWVFANSIGAANNYASLGLGLANSTGLNLSSFSLAYTGREWRGYSNSTPALSFQYKIGGTFDNDPTNSLTGSWTDFSSLNFTIPVTNNNAQLNGLVAPNFTTVSNTVTGLSWGTDQVLWLRWRQQNLAGTDAQMALDDIAFSAFGTLISGGNYWSAITGGGGGGIWAADGTSWATGPDGTGAGQAQSSATLIFANTAGTVTVSGGVTVSNGITFQTTGYNVESGTIVLGGANIGNNTVTTDTGVTTTISSELAGTNGLTKAGSGNLVLSGANTFSNNITISAGTLEIANESALGNAANDLANNGTLKTTSSISLDAGRDVSGSGTFDIANGTTLTVNGAFSNTATTLANSGTLSLQNATTRSVGNLTINAAATVNGAGAINASGLTASGLTSGTATVIPDIIFTSGDKTVNVAGGTLDLNGALSNGGGTGRLAKTGAGTLILSGSNTMGGLRIGATGATPTDGGTVILETSAVGTQAQAIQHNYGTLQAASALVITSGISIGGRTGAAATLAGSNMEFQGSSSFFRGNGTSGEMVLNVNNQTTLSGGLGATSGGGTATGVTVGGTGTLIISGNSTSFTDTITTANTVKLTVNNTLGGGVNVGSGTFLGGSGTIGALTVTTGGNLAPGNSPGTLTAASATFQVGANYQWEIFNAVGTAGTDWDLLAVTGDLNLAALSSTSQMNLILKSLSALPGTVGALAGFDPNDVAYSWTIARAGSITTAGGAATGGLDVTGLFKIDARDFNLGIGPLSGWKIMTGTDNGLTTLNLMAIPEPSAQSLMMLGMAGLVGMRAIRRRQS